MSRKCRCCLRDVIGSKCTYCNYTNVEVLDSSGDAAEEKRAEKYRNTILKRITDFSINAYTYKWNENNSKFDSGRSVIKIADVVNNYNTIVWSQKSFGQNFDGNQAKRPLTISYKFDGKKKELNIMLKTIKCDDFWKLGILIDKNLTIRFYLGTEKDNTVSEPFELDLK